MPVCPRCSAEIAFSDRKCPSCRLELDLTSDPTSIKPDSQDHTPTRLKETKAQSDIHTTTSSDGARFVAGKVLAERYRIIGLIGKGGMGEVYKAEDLKLEQRVALKFLPEELSHNEEALKRFIGEVRHARQVSHPNVCRVFDIGETEGLYYITMEFIEGDDLSMLLNRIGRLPSDKAVEVSRQICLGLAAIHKAGILHRDLKPANIIIDHKGEARITDFGIAGIEAEVQGEEAWVGTPAYMSPEQITGKEVTQKSDIYSLGLLLYEIFTGKQAFVGKSLDELVRKHETTNPTTPSDIVTGIDPLAEKVIKACIAKDPKQRPASALKVAMMLPGGDPLQVALEAGETPTPEMVAAAPTKGVLRPVTAMVLFAAFVGLTILSFYFSSIYTDAGWSPVYKSGDVLEEQAKAILLDAGYRVSGLDSASGFSSVQDYDFYVTDTGFSNGLQYMRTGQPFGVYFWYRQSSSPLVPREDQFVWENDPPRTEPGSEYVRLDVRGRLVELLAAPAKLGAGTTDGKQFDWSILFRKAGLEISELRETRSQWTPPVFGDTRKAWKGTMPDHSDIPIRIEAASYDGKPTYFKTIAPWQEVQPESALISGFDAAQFYPGIVLLIIVFVGGSFLAVRNIRTERIDRKGALKLGVYSAIFLGLGNVFAATIFKSPEGFLNKSEMIVGRTLVSVLALILLYLAVEPLVRRWWPDLLISWNRLLAGDFRSPIVGRDVLIGGILGMTNVCAFFIAGFLRDYVYTKELTRQSTSAIYALGGTRYVLEWLSQALVMPLISALVILTLLTVFYLVFRKKIVGTVILALLWATSLNLAYFLNRGFLAAAFGFAVSAVIVFIYARFGMVTIAVSFAAIFITGLPITFEFARPYFTESVVVLGTMLALGAYAFYISLGKQKLFEGRSIEDLTG